MCYPLPSHANIYISDKGKGRLDMKKRQLCSALMILVLMFLSAACHSSNQETSGSNAAANTGKNPANSSVEEAGSKNSSKITDPIVNDPGVFV